MSKSHARSAKADDYRAWYNSARWRRISKAQRTREPECAYCLARDPEQPVLATVADHVIPHRGDPHLFWHGELQSLCDTCHSAAKQGEEARGYSMVAGADGWPVDPKHPSNRPR